MAVWNFVIKFMLNFISFIAARLIFRLDFQYRQGGWMIEKNRRAKLK